MTSWVQNQSRGSFIRSEPDFILVLCRIEDIVAQEPIRCGQRLPVSAGKVIEAHSVISADKDLLLGHRNGLNPSILQRIGGFQPLPSVRGRVILKETASDPPCPDPLPNLHQGFDLY